MVESGTTTRKPRATKAASLDDDTMASLTVPDQPTPVDIAVEEAAKIETKSLSIVQAIAAVRKEAGALAPIQKSGVPFAFRGIDGTVNHLVPFLNRYGIITVPQVVYCNVSEREHKGGRVVKTSDVLVTYDFVAPDGSKVSATTPGLADDYADRSTAQAMSVAFRLALLQTFTLPTNDLEPEESGQKVLDGNVSAPRSVPAVERAKAQATKGADNLKALQTEAKVLGGQLQKSSADLNTLGESLVGDIDAPNGWFNSVEVMGLLVEALKAEVAAK